MELQKKGIYVDVISGQFFPRVLVKSTREISTKTIRSIRDCEVGDSGLLKKLFIYLQFEFKLYDLHEEIIKKNKKRVGIEFLIILTFLLWSLHYRPIDPFRLSHHS